MSGIIPTNSAKVVQGVLIEEARVMSKDVVKVCNSDDFGGLFVYRTDKVEDLEIISEFIYTNLT